MPAPMQRLDDSSLLRRRNLGTNRDGFEAPSQFLVGQLAYVATKKDIVGQDPDLTTDFPGDDVVVASENLNVNSGMRQRGDRSPGALLWWIEEGNIAE